MFARALAGARKPHPPVSISVAVARLIAKIGVSLVQPVFARWAEDVEFHRVVQSLRPMRQIRWDNDNLAGGHHDLLLTVVSEPEFQRAFDHVRELLVVMGVARHRLTLLEADLSEHDPLARDDPSRDRPLHGFGRLVLPPVVNRLYF